jgi:arylsulfatase A-like enzyme
VWLVVLLATAEGSALAGWINVSFGVLLPYFTGNGLRNLNPYAVWMSPLANAVLLLPLLAVVALVSGVAKRPERAFVVRLTSYAYAFAQGSLLVARIHPVTAIILAAGAGAVLARLTARPWWQQVVRGFAASFAIGAAVFALWQPLSREARYRRAIAALPAARDSAPNVLLLILDTVSASEMSLYGYERGTTPVLDSLARDGVVFDRAISPAPWTLPAHGSMFTGHPATGLSARYLRPLDDRQPVIAESFARAGYVTAGFVANLEYTSRASGLARGFHRYIDYRPSVPAAIARTPLGGRVIRAFGRRPGRPLQPGRKNAAEVNREFLGWQRGVGDRPWFAFLNYYDAHDPYVPPVPDERRFMRAGQQPVYRVEALRASDTAAVVSARALHDAALFSLDRAIGQLLDELRRRGELERTIIVVVADHGEEWGARGVLVHGNSLYLQAIHVPLLVVHPGQVPAGVRITRTVSTQDLAPTVLDLAGIPRGGIGGTSLVSSWDAEHGDAAPVTALSWVERAIRQPLEYPASRSELFSVVTDSAQVIVGADTMVFDLAAMSDTSPNRYHEPVFDDDVRRALQIIRQLPR